MKHKAKRLDNGEWIEGYYLPNPAAHRIVKDFALCQSSDYTDDGLEHCSGAYFLIDPSTLCQQVRGTEFFEWDEMTMNNNIGYLKYDEKYCYWYVQCHIKESIIWSFLNNGSWESTGRNINDELQN